MTTLDKILFATLSVAIPPMLLLAGMDLPNSLAGHFARFVFSCR